MILKEGTNSLPVRVIEAVCRFLFGNGLEFTAIDLFFEDLFFVKICYY